MADPEETVPIYDVAIEETPNSTNPNRLRVEVVFNDVVAPDGSLVPALHDNVIRGVEAFYITQSRTSIAQRLWALPVGRITSLLSDISDFRGLELLSIAPLFIVGTSKEFEDLGERLNEAFPELDMLILRLGSCDNLNVALAPFFKKLECCHLDCTLSHSMGENYPSLFELVGNRQLTISEELSPETIFGFQRGTTVNSNLEQLNLRVGDYRDEVMAVATHLASSLFHFNRLSHVFIDCAPVQFVLPFLKTLRAERAKSENAERLTSTTMLISFGGGAVSGFAEEWKMLALSVMNAWSTGAIYFRFGFSFPEAEKWNVVEEKLRFTKLCNWIVYKYELRDAKKQNPTVMREIAEDMRYWSFPKWPDGYQDNNYMDEPEFQVGLFMELIKRYPTLVKEG